ncbi:bifunctional phosphoribosylaminoimidazolecarboxamide formyltransferase/IMP cyclohydrolase, partial [Bacillus sp. SIMBA_069]
IDRETALAMKEIFLEIIIAPDFTEGALAVLTEKKNLRLLRTPALNEPDKKADNRFRVAPVAGGALVQDFDYKQLEES